MKALLDTRTFLWWFTDDPQLSPVARAFIADGGHDVFFSAASAWEIAIKFNRGRLELPETPERFVPNRLARHRFSVLPVQLSHALRVAALPELHTDPLDRLLVAQSQLESLPLLSADAEIARYDVDIIP